MTKRDLIESLSSFPDDAEMKIVTGTDALVIHDSMVCCNREHQIKINEIWLSTNPGVPPRKS